MNEFDLLTLTVVLCCSILSGATGILGGAILLAYLLESCSLSIAMIAHGAIQLSLNLFRAFFFKNHIRFSCVVPFVLGALGAFLILSLLPFSPNKALAFICLGLFGIVGVCVKQLPGVGFNSTSEIATAGVAVSGATVISGVGGPVLDTFFAGSTLTRLEIMGTKSVLQGFSHILKITYFVAVVEIGAFSIDDFACIPAYIAVAFTGTFIGKTCTFRMTERMFRRIQTSLILVTSIYFIEKASAYF